MSFESPPAPRPARHTLRLALGVALLLAAACSDDDGAAADQGVTGGDKGANPKLDKGPNPKLDKGTPPKLDKGANPKLDKGPNPKLDKGPNPKLDKGTPPKLDKGTPPKPDMPPPKPDMPPPKPGAPKVTALSIDVTEITDGQSVTFTAMVSDPNGLADIAGGILLDETSGKQIKAFTATATPGKYTAKAGWWDINSARVIDFTTEEHRSFRAQFSDKGGLKGSAITKVRLQCGGIKPACGGYCGTGRCGGKCIVTNFMTDSKNCGACGTVCPAGGSCQNGKCSCPAGKTECGGKCTDTQTDANNCGGCGKVCPSGGACTAGKCGCPAPTILCSGKCINPNSDPANCGACGVTCGTTCYSGLCNCSSINPCPAAYTCSDYRSGSTVYRYCYKIGAPRLGGAAGKKGGLLEVEVNGTWASLDYTGGYLAPLRKVVCQQLFQSGYWNPAKTSYPAGFKGPFISKISCTGNETAVSDCTFSFESYKGFDALAFWCK